MPDDFNYSNSISLYDLGDDWKKDTTDNANLIAKILRHHFKLLGFENEDAKIFASIIVFGPQTIATLIQKTNNMLHKDILKSTLSKLISDGKIIRYSKRNKKGPISQYYDMNISNKEIYDTLKENNNNLANDLSITLTNIKTIISTINLISNNFKKNHLLILYDDNVKKLISEITKLGLTYEVSKLLVFLSIFPDSDRDIIDKVMGVTSNNLSSSSLSSIIRELCYENCIDEKYKKNKLERRYSLKKPLYYISLDYTIYFIEELEQALEDTKIIINYLDDNPSVYKINYDPNKNINQYLQESPSNVLVENLKEYINDYKIFDDNTIKLNLKHPLSLSVRIYLFDISQAIIGDGINKIGSYRIRPYVKNNSRKKTKLNFSDVDFVMIGGYEPKYKQFVFWDAYVNSEIGNQSKLYVKESTLLSSMVNGVASESFNVIRKANGQYISLYEHIVSVSIDCIYKGIEKEYEFYLDNLIKGRI